VEHPGGPGRLLRVVPAGSETRKFRTDDGLESDPAAIRPVIRAGDRVVVEESSAVAEARLGAVALESARAGSALNVRLEIGGRVVRAVALGTGRAVFQVEIGVRR
jgi:flagella basal body P-ring formation protein FlgA